MQFKAFGLIEFIVAIAIFLIISVTGLTIMLGNFTLNRLGDETTEAGIIANEGLEAARSIRDIGWTNPFLSTNCASGCGVVASGTEWSWFGANNLLGKYTRTVYVDDVNRNVSGDIVNSGGTLDPNTKKIRSIVTWNFSPTRSNNITLITYLTNFAKTISSIWTNPKFESSIDILGNQDGLKAATYNSYAYVITANPTFEFNIINLTNTSAPTIQSSLSLAGSPLDIALSYPYVFIASDDNASELQIINVSNPSAPIIVGSYNAAGNSNARSVAVSGDTAYITRDSSASDEFVSINVTNKSSPTLRTSLDLGNIGYDITLLNNFAYIATASNTQELMVFNVTNPNSILQVGSYNAAGNSDGYVVTSFTNTVFLATLNTGDIFVLNVSSPSAPVLTSLYNGTSDINDMALNGTSNLYLATNSNTSEFEVINTTTLSGLILAGSYNVSTNTSLFGVAYNQSLNRVIAVGALNNAEILVLGP